MAELREPGMNNANKCVKMALKRAQVDAVLRCADLSQWFTQDLEEPQFIAPEAQGRSETQEPQDTRRVVGCTPEERRDIRMWLKMTGRSEAEILQHYRIDRVEDLPSPSANRVIRCLMEIRRGAEQAQSKNVYR